MASSNRHWPSLFKSKPCNNQQWPQPHDINPCARSSSSSSPFSSGCEERSPEPKPRWNPKPEQIRILEAIFNSGMVNPPRDEIRRIRAQLQEYGQVGDANVFYWFQNRKSRSKHKQRSKTATTTAATNQRAPPPMSASSSSSTTSSDKASPKKPRGVAAVAVALGDANNTNNGGTSNNNNNNNNVGVDQFGINTSPTSVNQCCSYFHPNSDQFVGQEPVFFPLQQSGASVLGGAGGGGGYNTHQGLGLNFHDHMGPTTGVSVGPVGEHVGRGFSNLLLGEMKEVDKLKFQQELSFLVTNAPPTNTTTCTTLIPTSAPNVISTPTTGGVITSNLGQILGVGEAGGIGGKSTIFMDNMTIDVPAGLYNVKETFGEDAMLVHPSGHPVLTNEWGVTLHPLQHGACYYVVRTAVAATPLLDKLDSTPDLLAPEFPYQI